MNAHQRRSAVRRQNAAGQKLGDRQANYCHMREWLTASGPLLVGVDFGAPDGDASMTYFKYSDGSFVVLCHPA